MKSVHIEIPPKIKSTISVPQEPRRRDSGIAPARNVSLNQKTPPQPRLQRAGKSHRLRNIILIMIALGLLAGGYLIYQRFQDLNSRVEKYDGEGNKVATCTNIL